MLLRIVFIVFLFLLAMSQVKAERVAPELPPQLEGWERIGGFEYYPYTPDTLYFVGNVYSGMANDLELALLKFKKVKILTLYSGGGLVSEGISAADIIRKHKLITYVAENTACASACGFMWLGGSMRVLDGDLGAHSMSASTEHRIPLEVAYREVQRQVGFLMYKLDSFDVPKLYYYAMLLTPPSQMYFFTKEEKITLSTGVDNYMFNKIDLLMQLRNDYLEKYYGRDE